MSRNWTPQQKNAIEAEGGTILVSAAAGSGKTAVLVERVIARLVDKESPTGADEILVATFTNGAAGEMKERISARLLELLEQSPGDSHLIKQRLLLETAAIGTVHSFCLQLIRENLGQLEIPPDFRIGDEKELKLLKEDAARELLEQRYEQGGENFFHMVELFSQGRDDSRVFETLFTLYDFIRSHPHYHRWLDEKSALYRPKSPLEKTSWGQVLLKYAKETLLYCRFMLGKAMEILQEDDLLEEKYGEHFRQLYTMAEELAETAEQGSWDRLRESLERVDFGRLPSVRGMSDHSGKLMICQYRTQVKEILEELSQKQFCCSAQEFAEDMEVLAPIVEELFALAKDFDKGYTRLKTEKRLIDFSDIEHLAIELLTEETSEGYRKTPLAESLSQKYKYILVDEYQDTNEAQDLIFSAVSNGKNLFMVGDVKQSIYRFRQAMPEIFLRKKEVFSPYNGQDYPAKIILGNNFRSRKEVTDIVNMLFRQLMSPEVGELLYNEEEALIPSAVYPPREGAGVQLHLLSYDKEENDLSSIEAEARYAAQRIKAMLTEGFPVSTGDGLRACEPGDFVILLRSVKNKADIYRKALEEEGLQALAKDGGGFLKSREISVLLSLLRTVDNPLLDIPLTAVLLSPVFAFTPDDLARLRMVDKKAALIVNCYTLAEQGEERWKAFIEALTEFRLLSSLYPADQLIRRIVEMTGFGAMVAAMENAPARLANLRLLSQYAHAYDRSGYKGLGGFLRFIDRLEEQKQELDGASAEAEDSDKVRIMSIHASKGLEFPIVFLCDTSKRFNRADLQGNTFLHPELGFAAMVRDFEARKQHTTIPVEAVKLELERSLLSEEMRMLYVAVTRAREQLVITSVQKDLSKKLASVNCLMDADSRLPSWAVRRGSSYADWILMSCLHHPSFGETARKNGVEPEGIFVTESHLEVTVTSAPEMGDKAEKKALLTAHPDEKTVKHLEETARWEYPYARQTTLPSKVSVTQLIKGEEGLEYAFSDTPDFVTGQKMTAADKGTALHQYMLFACHRQGCQDPRKEIARLVEEKYLTAMQGEAIPVKMLEGFYRSSLFKRMENAQNLQREFRFMSDVTAADLDGLMPELGEETITLQGVADALFEENGRLVIVDYKTDSVKTPQELEERYRGQLMLYGRVLSRILEKEVGELLLYSFKLGETIPIKE